MSGAPSMEELAPQYAKATLRMQSNYPDKLIRDMEQQHLMTLLRNNELELLYQMQGGGDKPLYCELYDGTKALVKQRPNNGVDIHFGDTSLSPEEFAGTITQLVLKEATVNSRFNKVEINFDGLGEGYTREAWLNLRSHGIEVKGYVPSDEDKQALMDRKLEMLTTGQLEGKYSQLGMDNYISQEAGEPVLGRTKRPKL